ncbi:PQQ-binding-like beta-propeller repeat protein [Tumebacillus lipolyticus]|uniref:PQQ-binding-like beta-propeller repeat protein n=1 Tax=Tumebacillus lipolyticus TaxID=1280370 RepID=A0ABW4ZXR1_9BACL
MSYQGKTDWKHEDVVTELDMNRIESGIGEAHQRLDALTPEQIGAETPSAAQAKVDAHAGQASGAHKASAIRLEDAGGHFTSTDVEGALAEVFTHGVDGKAQVASAINAKGGAVPGSAPYSFQELADGVSSIKDGDYSVGDTIPVTALGKNVLIDLQIEYIQGVNGMRLINPNSFRTRSSINVFAYDATGTQKWAKQVSGNSTIADFVVTEGEGTYAIIAAGSSGEGAVYFISSSGVSTQLSGQGIGSPNVMEYYNGHLYIGTTGRTITKQVVTSNTITTAWSYSFDSVIGNSVYSIGVDGEGSVYYTYLSTEAGNLRKRKSDGAIAWTYAAQISSPYVHVDRTNHRLYVKTGTTILRVNPDTGEAIWSRTPFAGSGSCFILGTDHEGNVYVSQSSNSGFAKLSPEGVVLWVETSIRTIYSSSRNTVVGDTVYLFNPYGYNNSVEMTRLVQSLTITS